MTKSPRQRVRVTQSSTHSTVGYLSWGIPEGLAPFADGGDPGGTAGSLVATVAVQPAARYYYEIVWYELELVVPTFYSGAVETIVKEGEKLGLDYDEIDYRVDNLVEGSATFFPCTNFIAGPFCEEAGITA